MTDKPIWQVRWYDPLAAIAWELLRFLPGNTHFKVLPYAGRWWYRHDANVPWDGSDGLGPNYDQ